MTSCSVARAARWATLLLAIDSIGVPDVALAQRPDPRLPRRQFVTVSLDWAHTFPLHFKEHPLEELVGQGLHETRDGTADYHADDDVTRVDVVRFEKRIRGAGVMLYPFGARSGPTLALRLSYEELPGIQVAIRRPGAEERYDLTDGRAIDVGAGVMLADLSPGWGLGSHAFLLGGIGRVRGERGDGRRIFAEAGGGVNVGPLGVQVALKFARNQLDDPREHWFLTGPLAIRGTLSF